MKTPFRTLWPALLLAAGILASSAVSLLSYRFPAWAMAGPLLLAVVTVATGARVHSYTRSLILGGAVLLAGGIVALADPASVPAIMPILGACAGVAVLPREKTCSQRSWV